MKKWQFPFLLLLIAGTVIILGRSRRESVLRNSYQISQGYVFGTTYRITYQYPEMLDSAINDALKRVDDALSMFNDSSTISRVNRNEPVDAAADTTFIHIFRLAQEISEKTGGAFDITVAPAVNAWGFGFKNAEDITDGIIDSLKEITGYRMVRESEGRIVKDDPRIMLDCSAIAKGYGCDVVAGVFRQYGIDNFLIEIGGEMMLSGLNAKGEKWSIGVSTPKDDPTASNNTLDTILHRTDCGIATSGNYRNFYEKGGVKYAHTIDPKSCRPVSHSLLSATVIAADCATADAFATAFMVMGADSAQAILKRNPELQAYLLVADGERTSSIDLLDKE